MRYQETPPPSALRRHVAALWSFTLEPDDPPVIEHKVPPDGGAVLAVVLGPQGVLHIGAVGPTLRAVPVPVHQGLHYLGLRATPGGAGLFLPGPASNWRDLIGPLALAAPGHASALQAALGAGLSPAEASGRLVAVASEWARSAAPQDVDVAHLVDRIVQSHGRASIQAEAASAGLSYRQLLRRFVASVGLQPKELARLRRTRHACLLALEQKGWRAADVSAEAGYADQPHMSREFMAFFGWPPRLALAYLRRIEHQGVARSGGQAAQ